MISFSKFAIPFIIKEYPNVPIKLWADFALDFGSTMRNCFEVSNCEPSRDGHILMKRKIRIVMAKPGLDGHDRGIKVLARAYRDAGMEVIYTGLRQTPEQIVESALQEDADVIGLSILSGAHNHICPRLMELLKEKGLDDVLVVIGGIIPDVDVEKLKSIGVGGVFQPGTPMKVISEFIQGQVRRSVADVAT